MVVVQAVGSFKEQVKENRLVNEDTEGGWGPKSSLKHLRSHLWSPGYRDSVKSDGGSMRDKHTDCHPSTEMSFQPR